MEPNDPQQPNISLPIIPITLATLPANLILKTRFKPISVSWIQIAKVGEFKGHSAANFSLTPEFFNNLIKNFESTENQAIPIDYEHASEMPPYLGSIPTEGVPALGWITKLDNRQKDGLWGLVEWVDQKAVDYIREAKYRFFSPAIALNSKDPVTGKSIGPVLTSGALTNKPFLDGMEPLTASQTSQTDSNKPLTTKKETQKTMPDSEITNQSTMTLSAALFSKIAVVLGLTMLPTSEDQILASIQSTQAKLKSQSEELEKTKNQLSQTETQLESFKKLESDRILASAKNQVQKLVDLGIIYKEATESALSVCLSNPKAFSELFDKKILEAESKEKEKEKEKQGKQALLTTRLVPRSGNQLSQGSKEATDSLLMSKTQEIQKANPNLDYFEAMAKAAVELQPNQ